MHPKLVLFLNGLTIISYEHRFLILRLYLNNICNDNAEYFAKGIMQHWHIENKLHWVKDVQLNEDKSFIRNKNTTACYLVLMSWALNIARFNGFNKWKDWLEKFTNRIDRIVKII